MKFITENFEYPLSDNKPSSIALHQNHAIVFIKMLESNSKILNLNFNLPKSMWDSAENSTVSCNIPQSVAQDKIMQ